MSHWKATSDAIGLCLVDAPRFAAEDALLVSSGLPAGWSEATLVLGHSVADRVAIPPAVIARLISNLADRGADPYFAIAEVMGEPDSAELVAVGTPATRIWTVRAESERTRWGNQEEQRVFAPGRAAIEAVVERWWTDDIARFVVFFVHQDRGAHFEATLAAGYGLLERCGGSVIEVIEHRSHCTIVRSFTNARSAGSAAFAGTELI